MLALILLALEFIDSKEKQEFIDFVFIATTAVSYTHLTLPTNREV